VRRAATPSWRSTRNALISDVLNAFELRNGFDVIDDRTQLGQACRSR
jgi:hypothetical protein